MLKVSPTGNTFKLTLGVVWRIIWFGIIVQFLARIKGKIMEYLSLRQTAEKWGLSIRGVQPWWITGRIPGAKKIGPYWAFPVDAEKPKDERIKSGKYVKRV